jgi:hypothetical protein
MGFAATPDGLLYVFGGSINGIGKRMVENLKTIYA